MTSEAVVRSDKSLAGCQTPEPSLARPRDREPGLAKRVVDLIGASILLVVTAPVMILAIAAVRTTSRGPAFFKQTRIGRNGRPFTMLKLRTMRVDNDDAAHRDFNRRELLGEAMPEVADGIFKPTHDPRITAVGHLLRRFSIDELPQVFNVLWGEMSLVGPRPSLPWEVEVYTTEQRRRHDCLPGITGLWQVSGRNRRTMLEMLTLDLTYVDTRTLLLDVRILLRTPSAVLFDRNTR